MTKIKCYHSQGKLEECLKLAKCWLGIQHSIRRPKTVMRTSKDTSWATKRKVWCGREVPRKPLRHRVLGGQSSCLASKSVKITSKVYDQARHAKNCARQPRHASNGLSLGNIICEIFYEKVQRLGKQEGNLGILNLSQAI